MEILKLKEIKANSRIDTDIEDVLLVHLADVAEEMVTKAIRKSWGDVLSQYKEIPRPLHHACLMIVDHLYTNRSATTPVSILEMPIGVQTMIKPYVKLMQ